MSGSPYTPQPGYTPPQHDSSGMKFAILFGAVIALIAANIFLYLQIDGLKQQTAKMQESILNEVGRVRETESVTSAAATRNMEDLKAQLAEAKRQASQSAGQAKLDAQKHAEELTARLAAAQAKEKQELESQISKVDEAATSKIGAVSSDVSSVRTEVSATKSELDKTIASLHTTQGDLGVQSGLIATNGKELAALKALNDRNYFEFTLTTKEKKAQRVGDIMLKLKKADQKTHLYTMDVSVDDNTIPKKDKGLFEPVQFITTKARQPYEIVVNSVKKNQVSGYLATPKVQGNTR
ncbi:MAG: hypothetical protein ACLQBJ_08695 [Bryobacteraceae bacterium]